MVCPCMGSMQQQPGRWILLKQVSLSFWFVPILTYHFQIGAKFNQLNVIRIPKTQQSSNVTCMFSGIYIWYLRASILLPWSGHVFVVNEGTELFPVNATCSFNIHLQQQQMENVDTAQRWVTNFEQQNPWLNQTTKSSLFCLWLHYCLQIYVYIYT